MPPALTIRRARVSEQGHLEELQRRASLANEHDRAALLAHPDAIELPRSQIESGRVWVAESEAGIVGFAVTLPRNDGSEELDGLFVEPDRWGGGIGRVLVEHCAQVARIAGATALHVVGNPHARGFYLACGFAIEGESQTRFGPGLLMVRQL